MSAELELLVFSPHFDDAALSCGATLAAVPGAVVCTVFGGRPHRVSAELPVTVWDARCGFAAGADVVGERRAEDERALAILGGRPHWLDFVDSQYVEAGTAPPNTVAGIRDALAAVLEELAPRRVAAPLGLFHRDHRTVAAACRPLLDGRWQLWSDVPYRDWAPVGTRLAALARCGVTLSAPDEVPDPDGRKRAAIEAYTSQQRGLRWLGLRDGPTEPAPPDLLFSVLRGSRPAPPPAG